MPNAVIPAGTDVIIHAGKHSSKLRESQWERIELLTDVFVAPENVWCPGDKRLELKTLCKACKTFVTSCHERDYVPLIGPDTNWWLLKAKDAIALLSDAKGN